MEFNPILNLHSFTQRVTKVTYFLTQQMSQSMKIMCWPSHRNPWVLFQSPSWLSLAFPQSVFILDPFKKMYLNLLVASILLHSKSKVEFRKRANKIRAEVQTKFLSTFHVDVPNPVFLPLHGSPMGPPLKVSVVFFFFFEPHRTVS